MQLAALMPAPATGAPALNCTKHHHEEKVPRYPQHCLWQALVPGSHERGNVLDSSNGLSEWFASSWKMTASVSRPGTPAAAKGLI
jgi:hypothetical protein